MGCWKWFNKALKEAGVEVTDANRAQVEGVIHEYIGEQSTYGRCSADWKRARVEIRDNEQMLRELISRLRAVA